MNTNQCRRVRRFDEAQAAVAISTSEPGKALHVRWRTDTASLTFWVQEDGDPKPSIPTQAVMTRTLTKSLIRGAIELLLAYG